MNLNELSIYHAPGKSKLRQKKEKNIIKLINLLVFSDKYGLLCPDHEKPYGVGANCGYCPSG